MTRRLVDTRIAIYSHNLYNSVGQYSRFVDTPHPGTMNTIQGWLWDKRRWSSPEELKSIAYSPVLWNADSSGLSDDFFQSGIGTNPDILMLEIIKRNAEAGVDFWVPKLQNGHYFVNQHPWFLYSDWAISLTMANADVDTGKNFVDLPINTLPTLPITVAMYEFEADENGYVIATEMEHVLEEDVDGNELQYYLDSTSMPPRLYLSNQYITEIGEDYVEILGELQSDSVDSWEFLGYGDNTNWQTFRSRFAPIDGGSSLQLISYKNYTEYIIWTVLSEGEEFTDGNTEVKINTAKGIIEFGNWDGVDGDGSRPAADHHIILRYMPSFAVTYEPDFSKEEVLAHDADINPLNNNIFAGFVQVTRSEPEPAFIVLDVVDEVIDGDGYFGVEMGNAFLQLVATVTDRRGDPLQNKLVTFNLPAAAGSFGGKSSISALTNSEGKAYTSFNPPANLEEMAIPTDITASGPLSSTLTAPNVIPVPGSSTFDHVYLYAVYNNDPALGMTQALIDQDYTDMLIEEGIVSGPTANIDWEKQHRALYDLGVPLLSPDGEEFVGQKRLMITQGKTFAVNVHGTGEPLEAVFDTNIFVPIHPFAFSTIEQLDGSTLSTLEYDLEIDPPDPGTNNIKAYLLLTDSLARAQATTSSIHSNRLIKSNVIEIRITISGAANGTVILQDLETLATGLLSGAWDITDTMMFPDIDLNETSTFGSLNDAYIAERLVETGGIIENYADWFRRTKRGATDLFVSLAAWDPHPWLPGDNPFSPGLPLVNYNLTTYAELPIGFRIRSTGLTLASMLDQVLYLDPNDHLPGNYWD